ncbi:hypothetical protein [Caballeronia hypogeia]|uniref:hypothetical protein n=1 Tax=Caballeronia hypogeia TaxID=1777140 RepID=UPI0018DF0313
MVSIDMARFRTDEDTRAKVIAAADRAFHRAKSLGGNQPCFSPPDDRLSRCFALNACAADAAASTSFNVSDGVSVERVCLPAASAYSAIKMRKTSMPQSNAVLPAMNRRSRSPCSWNSQGLVRNRLMAGFRLANCRWLRLNPARKRHSLVPLLRDSGIDCKQEAAIQLN